MKWELRSLFCATNANLCWLNLDANICVVFAGIAWLLIGALCFYGALIYDDKT